MKIPLKSLTFPDICEIAIKFFGADTDMFQTVGNMMVAYHQTGAGRIFDNSRSCLYKVDATSIWQILEGSADISVGPSTCRVYRNSVIHIPMNSIIYVSNASPDFMVNTVTFSKSFDFILVTADFPNNIMPVTELNDSERCILDHMYASLFTSVRYDMYNWTLVSALKNSIVEFLCICNRKKSERDGQANSRQDNIFNRFMSEISHNEGKERSLKYYSDKLCITDKYLSTMVKKQSGKTAKYWIDHAVVSYAKMLLKYSAMPVNDIAELLQFSYSGAFIKYFKRQTGITPGEFRDQQVSQQEMTD